MTSIEPVSVNGYRASNAVGNALRAAADATGADFDYLVQTAYRESSFRPALTAETSSATGLFQFIEQTWLATVKSDGARFGLTSEANSITKRGDGRYVVQEPDQRQHILNLRKDPVLSAKLAGVLTEKNDAYLRQKTGQNPTSGELYIAHFLGAKGAVDLISAARDTPTQSATQLFPDAAKANKSLFYGKGGDPKTVQQVYAGLISKHQSVGAPLALRPDPANTLESHAPAQERTAATASLDSTNAAFLASHFGSAVTAFSAGLDGEKADFGGLFSNSSNADTSSFFLPKSRYAAEHGERAASLGNRSQPSTPDPSAPIPSRYGRADSDDILSNRPSEIRDANLGTNNRPEAQQAPSVFGEVKPVIITSSEFGKTDLPLDFSQYLKAYQTGK